MDDLGDFVLLCRNFALHDCFLPLYVTFIVGEERAFYPTLTQRNVWIFALSYLIWN